jgi:spore germination protein
MNQKEIIIIKEPINSSFPLDYPREAQAKAAVHRSRIIRQSRNFAAITSLTPFTQHLQTIIKSENVAKIPQAFGHVYDFFLRYDTRRGIKVMIAEEEAGPILGIQPTPENPPVTHIDSIAENAFKNANILPERRLGAIHEHLVNKTSFVVPKIKTDGEKINLTGVAVFHGHANEMLGFINGDIAEGLTVDNG